MEQNKTMNTEKKSADWGREKHQFQLDVRKITSCNVCQFLAYYKTGRRLQAGGLLTSVNSSLGWFQKITQLVSQGQKITQGQNLSSFKQRPLWDLAALPVLEKGKKLLDYLQY